MGKESKSSIAKNPCFSPFPPVIVISDFHFQVLKFLMLSILPLLLPIFKLIYVDEQHELDPQHEQP